MSKAGPMAPFPSIRSLLLAAIGCLPAPAMAAAVGNLPLMPLPQAVEQQAGELRLTGPLAPEVRDCTPGMVPSAVARFGRDLVLLAGEPMGRDGVRLVVRCLARDPGALSLEAREGYRLTVSPAGAEIEADGEAGVLRALATLRQLVMRDAKGPAIPAVRIADAPRFPWRGVMLDTARHFVTVPTLKRQIDAMELAKLNVLHLHLSDNEGFRVESKVFPRLVTTSADGRYYTQDEIREIVRYAAERGVRIVPEFDIPGHSLAKILAYPELAIAPIDSKDPLAKPKGALNPASEKTYRFLERLFAEMAPLFPDRQFHVGGDEVSDLAWKESAEVEAFKRKHGLTTKLEVEGKFHERIRRILARHGKTTVGWDEMAETPLPKDVIVQAWRTSNPISTATAKGNRVVVSAGLYLNNLQAADTHYAIDPLDPMAYSTFDAATLANVRRNPVSAAQVSDGLVAKPVPPLTPEQERLVIGGEAPLWAELVNDELVDGRLWPRALALAERFWSPATVRDADAMYARLLPAMEQLRALGLQDEAIRRRMVARLAPRDVEVVSRLVGLVAPARHGINHPEGMMGRKPDLVELSDIASTDGTPARAFRANVAAYLAGDRSRAAVLRAEMQSWVANLPAYEAVAVGQPLLAKASPIAREIAALGETGLRALDALEQGRTFDPGKLDEARTLVARHRAWEEASADYGVIATRPQPPAALLVLVAPAVQRLLEAATRQGN